MTRTVLPFAPILALLVVGILLGRRSPGAIIQLADDYGGDFALPRVPTTTIAHRFHALQTAPAGRRSGALEAVLRKWIAARLPPDDVLVVNMDGKFARGSADRAAQLPGVHLLAAFAPRFQAVLAQLRVDTKTNEHKAAGVPVDFGRR
ncbi:hypothetical protein J8F10_10385 [Gemmata sp. G18]|uniref:Uncharacterized protein n=1 Tax=Gemmata palustris TaxID=2822762 RepID=A0ABS5BPS5_9BACT|nr:hypothetical protein [Gemmata palustris]